MTARVRLALIDPEGRLAEYSVPQGVGNYGDVQVSEPTPGKWTAYIWSRDTADGGTTGPVVFGASVASYQPFGNLSTSRLTIPAGATRSFSFSASTPLQARRSGRLDPGQRRPTSRQTIPVSLRSLVPTGATSFSGILTGGNGRSVVNGQTDYYQIDLPAGEPALNATVTLADNPNNHLAWLIDPSGQAEAFQTNVLITEDSSGTSRRPPSWGPTCTLSPAAGRWTLAVLFAPTVSGTALSEPFTVAVNQARARSKRRGAPRQQDQCQPPGSGEDPRH